MIKKIVKRNKQKFTAIFKEGRKMFPKGEFTTLTYLGRYNGIGIFSAKEGYSVGNITFCKEATWS